MDLAVLPSLFLEESSALNRKVIIGALVVFVGVLFAVTSVYTNPTSAIAVVVLVTFAAIVATVYVTVSKRTSTDVNRNTQRKLEQVSALVNEPLDAMYMDSRIIHFVHSIADLQKYNPREFARFVRITNYILRVLKDSESNPANTAEMYSSVLIFKTKGQNCLHNLMYSTPKQGNVHSAINSAREAYTLLIDDAVSTIRKRYESSITDVGIRTRFINPDVPSGIDSWTPLAIREREFHTL